MECINADLRHARQAQCKGLSLSLTKIVRDLPPGFVFKFNGTFVLVSACQ